MFQLKSIKCGKQECKKCPHDGYLYKVKKENGKTKSKYIGKLIDLDLFKVYCIELNELYKIKKGKGLNCKTDYFKRTQEKLFSEINELEKLQRKMKKGKI